MTTTTADTEHDPIEYEAILGPDPEPTYGEPDEIKVSVPFCGLYESCITGILELHTEMETEWFNGAGWEPDLKSPIVDALDMEYTYDKWLGCVTSLIEEWTGVIVPMRYAGVYHPKEYNFETDELYAWAKKEDLQKLVQYVLHDPATKKELDALVKEATTPRSGYMPFEHISYDYESMDVIPAVWELLLTAAIPDCLFKLEDRFMYEPVDEFYPVK